jgi:hypothetical protein
MVEYTECIFLTRHGTGLDTAERIAVQVIM